MYNIYKIFKGLKIVLITLFFSVFLTVVFYLESTSYLKILFIAYIFMINDIISTYYISSSSYKEENPIAAYLFDKFGIIIGGLIIKNFVFLLFLTIIFTISPTSLYLEISYLYFLPSFLLSSGIVATGNNLYIYLLK